MLASSVCPNALLEWPACPPREVGNSDQSRFITPKRLRNRRGNAGECSDHEGRLPTEILSRNNARGIGGGDDFENLKGHQMRRVFALPGKTQLRLVHDSCEEAR